MLTDRGVEEALTDTKNNEPILDVVGADEAKDILKVELGRISRWRASGKLPPPYSDLRASPVWLRTDIEYVRDHKNTAGCTPPPKQKPLLGTAEVAELLGVSKSQVSRWRTSPPKTGPKFPLPATRVRASPLWDRRKIVAFARARKARQEKTQQEKAVA